MAIDYVQVGQRLRAHRVGSGMSPEQVAERLEISRAALYNYEKGEYAVIPFHWDDARHSLTIGDRKGQFLGMLDQRSFQIVLVRENHGVGIGPEDQPDRVVQYSGKQITVIQ